jgi:ABC-2 type transport system permease protein
VGAAATKSIMLGILTLVTARAFVPYQIEHPLWMGAIHHADGSTTFSLFGFIIGLWSDDFEQVQFIPLMVVTPLTFLGGAFYSVSMLPPLWQKITLFNPVVYLISGFRWSFYEASDVSVTISLAMTLAVLRESAWRWWPGYSRPGIASRTDRHRRSARAPAIMAR